jgi:tetratricopeptide (TPR) repeat protein
MLSLVQFGLWDRVLELDPPAERLEYANAIWHYARSVAYSNKGNIESAQKERQMIESLKDTNDVLHLDSIYYPASMLLEIADSLALGEIAISNNDYQSAIQYFANAVSVQDALPYTEPPFWYYPTRLSLGKAYLLSDQADEAEVVFEENLKRYPRNGWALYGLIQALELQNKDSSSVQEQFDIIWQNADVELTSSRF